MSSDGTTSHPTPQDTPFLTTKESFMSTTTPQAGAGTSRDSRSADRANRGGMRSLVASTVGQMFEWYEWTAYAVFATFIAGAMFHSGNEVSALLSTLAVFAVGFLMRPLGGIVFGRIADARGRKFVLVTTMLTMAVASLLMGLLPTYDSIGVLASVLLLVLRMVQGFAHGGESATANSYVAEIAPANRRGMWGSLVYVAIMSGTVVAYAIGGGITEVLSESAVASWGWRVPFLLGALFALFVLYLRSGMEESDVFDRADGAADVVTISEVTTPTATPGAGYGRGRLAAAIGLVIMMVSGVTVAHYTWSSYASTFAITQRGMDPGTAFWAITISQLVALFTLPLWGRLSDSIGRRPVVLIFAVGTIVTTVPLKAMISDTFWSLTIASFVAMVFVAAAGAVLSSMMSEAFPTKVRAAGIGFAYSMSVAVFGGSAPYLNAFFIDKGMDWLVNGYIIALCVCTILATLAMKETRAADLHLVGQD